MPWGLFVGRVPYVSSSKHAATHAPIGVLWVNDIGVRNMERMTRSTVEHRPAAGKDRSTSVSTA
jgi:hypothetical protein